MSNFQWQESFDLGIEQIDEELHEIVDQVNTMIKTHGEGDPDCVAEAFMDMAVQVQYHFNSEERMMLEARYPEYEKHRREHAIAVAENLGCAKKLTGEKKISASKIEHIKDWIANHIKTRDRDFADYLHRQIEGDESDVPYE